MRCGRNDQNAYIICCLRFLFVAACQALGMIQRDAGGKVAPGTTTAFYLDGPPVGHTGEFVSIGRVTTVRQATLALHRHRLRVDR